jgi:hypothetical protein
VTKGNVVARALRGTKWWDSCEAGAHARKLTESKLGDAIGALSTKEAVGAGCSLQMLGTRHFDVFK